MLLLIFTVCLVVLGVITLIVLIVQGKRKASPEVILVHSLGVSCKNTGKETAFNVKVSECELNVFSIFFQPISVLEPGASTKLEYRIVGRNKEAYSIIKGVGETYLGFPYFEGMKVEKYWLNIHYEDAKKKEYKTEMVVDCRLKKITVEKIGKA